MPYPNLLNPLTLGPYELRNRVFMSPLTRGRATPSGTPTPIMAKHYAQRASAGLLVTEATNISVQARGWYCSPDIHTEEHVKAWKTITDAVHAKGGRIFCQLWHTGRCTHSNFRKGLPGFEGELAKGIAPSAVKRKSQSGKQLYTMESGGVDIETPREITRAEIEALPAEYKHAATMAKKAGFDGVSIMLNGGYLLDEFLQSCSNFRTDEYGGSLENRFRIVDRVIRAVKEVWGDCVGAHLTPNNPFNGMGSEDFREQALYCASRLNEYRLAFLFVVIGTDLIGFHGMGKPMTVEEFREIYKGLLVVNSGLGIEGGERAIADGKADAVAFGRYFISNPDLVERIAKGAKLNEADSHETWYTSVGHDWGEKGYTDYPTMAELA